MSDVSDWADKIKRNKEYSYTKEWHYIDILKCSGVTSNTITDACNDKCIYSAIKSLLKPDAIAPKEDALKFLIHLAQDINQPMHTYGKDKGGNNFRIKLLKENSRNSSINVHQLWDTYVPEYYTNRYSFNIVNIRRPTLDVTSFLKSVVMQNLKIGCDVYPISDFVVLQDYFNRYTVETLFERYLLTITEILYAFYDAKTNEKI
jgi:S1/P1 Nuclease